MTVGRAHIRLMLGKSWLSVLDLFAVHTIQKCHFLLLGFLYPVMHFRIDTRFSMHNSLNFVNRYELALMLPQHKAIVLKRVTPSRRESFF